MISYRGRNRSFGTQLFEVIFGRSRLEIYASRLPDSLDEPRLEMCANKLLDSLDEPGLGMYASKLMGSRLPGSLDELRLEIYVSLVKVRGEGLRLLQ
ncbi:hypothetical protein RclHR1_00350012 [Rhizophagus clarus]|uniref:Uncharacterized protein n=1 Tax=Rhizophagus clarus TaxID=94130 RepID=A0A2Z6S514_9GLOM|nr:hypothetical protein RclHR1_00350012 [Rhizophagus clarus]